MGGSGSVFAEERLLGPDGWKYCEKYLAVASDEDVADNAGVICARVKFTRPIARRLTQIHSWYVIYTIVKMAGGDVAGLLSFVPQEEWLVWCDAGASGHAELSFATLARAIDSPEKFALAFTSLLDAECECEQMRYLLLNEGIPAGYRYGSHVLWWIVAGCSDSEFAIEFLSERPGAVSECLQVCMELGAKGKFVLFLNKFISEAADVELFLRREDEFRDLFMTEIIGCREVAVERRVNRVFGAEGMWNFKYEYVMALKGRREWARIEECLAYMAAEEAEWMRREADLPGRGLGLGDMPAWVLARVGEWLSLYERVKLMNAVAGISSLFDEKWVFPAGVDVRLFGWLEKIVGRFGRVKITPKYEWVRTPFREHEIVFGAYNEGVMAALRKSLRLMGVGVHDFGEQMFVGEGGEWECVLTVGEREVEVWAGRVLGSVEV